MTGYGSCRIIVATDGVWRVAQVAEAIQAIEGVTCRLAAASVLAELLKDHEDYFANLRIMGLINKGVPKDWGESPGGSDALARQDYLKCTAVLRQHGIEVRETSTSWALTLTFSDIIEFIPKSRRLEVEFMSMGSPGKLGFLMPLIRGASKFTDTLLHTVYLSFADSETRKQMIEDYRREFLAHLEFKEELVREQKAKNRRINAEATDIENRQHRDVKGSKTHTNLPIQVDLQQTVDTFLIRLQDAGLLIEEVRKKILQPYEKDLAKLYRLKGQGLIVGLSIEFLDPDSMEKSSEK